MRRPILWFVIFAVAAPLLAAPALADVYRWVDASGKVHYSDTPPPEGAERLPMSSGKARVPTSAKSQDSGKNKPKTAAEAQAALQKTQCDYWQARLEAYQTNKRIVVTEDDGSKHELSADEKAKEIKQAKSYLDANCEK